MEEVIQYEKRGAVALITLNRPDKRNAVNPALVCALSRAVEEAGADGEVRCIILRGAGKGFCAGGDISAGKLESVIADYADLEHTQACTRLLYELPKPTIAAVQGAAAGMGFSLALACDMVICAENAKFVMSFANVGLVPDSGATYLLPRLVGVRKAKELLFTCRPVPAQEALALGIAGAVVPEDGLEQSALSMAERMAALSPNSIKFTKLLLNQSSERSMEEMLRLECCYQAMAFSSKDAEESVKAFFEKRTPSFRGV